MWARKCGAAPQWPSRVKVSLQGLMMAGLGLTVYTYMGGADIGYLDLTNPESDESLCLSEWLIRHKTETWLAAKVWQDWHMYRTNFDEYISQHQCTGNVSISQLSCSSVRVPITGLDRHLGIPMIQQKAAYGRNDAIEGYGHLFLWMSICLWACVTVHDLALLSEYGRDHILDLSGVKQKFPRWQCLWRLSAVKTWARLVRGKGLRCGRRDNVRCMKYSRLVGIVLTPFFFLWAFLFFFLVIMPFIGLLFLRYPISLSRVVLFINANACGIFGTVMTVHALMWVIDPTLRQQYSITWDTITDANQACICGCTYHVARARCVNLMCIGVVTAYKSFTLAFRCLKGLRRSNWSGLMSVLFPVPLTVYEVYWTRPDGSAITFRKDCEPVQGELAFDPFALLDEQEDSGKTTVHFIPHPILPQDEPAHWDEDNVVTYLEGIGLAAYGEAARSHGINGSKLLELIKENRLSEIGVAETSHVHRICKQLPRGGSLFNLSRSGSQHTKEAQRKFAGPRPRTPSTEFDEFDDGWDWERHYIGCCGFPCKKSKKKCDDDSDLPDEERGANQIVLDQSAQGDGTPPIRL